MAQTQRSLATVYSLLADNTAGTISPVDLRDAFESWRPTHGQIYVAAADAAAITISDTTNYFEATAPVWTLSTGAHSWDESAGNGRLTYTGAADVWCHVAFSFSATASGVNKLTHYRIGKNTTPDPASEIQRFVGTGTDVGAGACHLITDVTNGDYLSVWVRNASTATTITIETANLQVVTMPK